jgi:hypothetical protein
MQVSVIGSFKAHDLKRPITDNLVHVDVRRRASFARTHINDKMPMQKPLTYVRTRGYHHVSEEKDDQTLWSLFYRGRAPGL